MNIRSPTLIQFIVKRSKILRRLPGLTLAEVVVVYSNLIVGHKLVAVITDHIRYVRTVVGSSNPLLDSINIVTGKGDNVPYAFSELLLIPRGRPKRSVIICRILDPRADPRKLLKVLQPHGLPLKAVIFQPCAEILLGGKLPVEVGNASQLRKPLQGLGIALVVLGRHAPLVLVEVRLNGIVAGVQIRRALLGTCQRDRRIPPQIRNKALRIGDETAQIVGIDPARVQSVIPLQAARSRHNVSPRDLPTCGHVRPVLFLFPAGLSLGQQLGTRNTHG